MTPELLAEIAGWILLLGSLVGAGLTLNAFVPSRRSQWLTVPSSLLSMFAAELAAYHLLWQLVVGAGLVALGATQNLPGRIGLAIALPSWIGLVILVAGGRRALPVIRSELAGLGDDAAQMRVPWTRVFNPFPLRRSGTRVVRNVPFADVAGRTLRMDVYLPRERSGLRPAVIQIHGGGWVVGDKREQGVPLLTRLSDRGIVGFNVNYRLSPGATFPDHLVDVKRGIAWIRAHAADYAIDPDFLVITGGSAGGHLAAMAALTAHETRFQPGFESADTSVAGAIPLYAIYDFTDAEHTHPRGFHEILLEPLVMKARYADDPARFADASPITHVHPDAPPFFVIHGSRDTMAPLAEARRFVARLRAVSHQPVLFAEIAGAQHAFDVFASPRSVVVIEGVAGFVEHLWRAHVAGRPAATELAEARVVPPS